MMHYNYNKYAKKTESVEFETTLSLIAIKTNSQPRLYRNGYIVRCPSHNDTNPSLSISEGNGGRVLLYCFTGCSIHDVCAALGLRLSDLFVKQRGGHYGK